MVFKCRSSSYLLAVQLAYDNMSVVRDYGQRSQYYNITTPSYRNNMPNTLVPLSYNQSLYAAFSILFGGSNSCSCGEQKNQSLKFYTGRFCIAIVVNVFDSRKYGNLSYKVCRAQYFFKYKHAKPGRLLKTWRLYFRDFTQHLAVTLQPGK